MDITFVTSAQSDDEARTLLKALGLPMKKSGEETVPSIVDGSEA